MTCYGCKFLTSKIYADGTTLYGCALIPGLVIGETSAFDDDEPVRCEDFTVPARVDRSCGVIIRQ